MQLKVQPGSLEEALAHGWHLLADHPAVALKQAETLLRAGPDPRALRLAAAAHRKLDRPPEAEQAELAAIRASLGNPDLERAAIAEKEGRSGEAKALADAVLRKQPDDLLALTMAAESAIGLRAYEDADALLRKVLDRAPSFARASMLLARSLTAQSRLRDAIALLQTMVSGKPDYRPALEQLAQARAEVGDHEEAASVCEQLLALNDADPETWIIYAQNLRILGRGEDSRNALRKALSADPLHGPAWWALAHYFAPDLDADDEQSIRRILVERAGTRDHAGPAHIALSIIAERRGEREDAFRHVAEGKRLRGEGQSYTPDFVAADVEQSLRNFTAALYAERAACGFDDPSPVFIVGLPRSGSTLVERIFGRHSQIEATGELQVMARMVDRLRHQAGRELSFSALVASLPCDELTDLGRTYIERSGDFRRTGKPRFVDKFNLNWLHAGLVRLILPNAMIIDVRRGAVDCCWANFKMLFADDHANDLREIGRFYRAYVRFIEGVEKAAPGGILSVRYEKIVDDIEGETRRMLDFLGLDFEPECIAFHLSNEPVATPSSEQVRRPLNRDSIGAAEPYRRWLEPLIEELGPLAAD